MIFDKRVNLKPYEYDLQHYVDAIRNSFWIHTEYSYTTDVQDYKVNMNDVERDVVRKCMLSISQIEVAVKRMRADIGRILPKPEIDTVGITFGFNETIHADLYSHVLTLLNLDGEFEKIKDIPVFQKRVEYLQESLRDKEKSREDFLRCLICFTLFIENVTLFSQLLILMSMNKHKGYLKGMTNGISSTSLEESLHAEFGAELINIIRSEYPEMFTDELLKSICDMSSKALETELEVIEWIFEKGELEYLSKGTVREYVKYRMNKGLKMIGMDTICEATHPEDLEWFETELLTSMHTDFFHRKSRSYSKKVNSITSDDLF